RLNSIDRVTGRVLDKESIRGPAKELLLGTGSIAGDEIVATAADPDGRVAGLDARITAEAPVIRTAGNVVEVNAIVNVGNDGRAVVGVAKNGSIGIILDSGVEAADRGAEQPIGKMRSC